MSTISVPVSFPKYMYCKIGTFQYHNKNIGVNTINGLLWKFENSTLLPLLANKETTPKLWKSVNHACRASYWLKITQIFLLTSNEYADFYTQFMKGCINTQKSRNKKKHQLAVNTSGNRPFKVRKGIGLRAIEWRSSNISKHSVIFTEQPSCFSFFVSDIRFLIGPLRSNSRRVVRVLEYYYRSVKPA